MFGFFKRKVNETDIKAFSNALEAIDIYIKIFEWEKAKKACQEIIYKEKKSLENYLQNSDEKPEIKEKKKKEFEEKQEKIKKLEEKIKILEEDYNDKIKKNRFEARFASIKKEINALISQGKPKDALFLLNNFYEENKKEVLVINFYKAQKSVIQKVIDKKMSRLKSRIEANAELEAKNLLGQKISENLLKEEKKEKNFFEKIKSKFKFWKDLKEKREEKKLLDEVNILIEEDNKIKKELAEKRLAKMHSGLVKELVYESMIGYDLYGKILGADKISGDTFGIEENKENYLMFLGDATGHGVKAGFIISIFNKVFKSIKNKKISDIYFEINNQLKQTLESKNFITGALFEINKETNNINYAGMGHEPIFIYRAKTGKVERKVLGGLAAGIRIIKDREQIKIKNIELDEGDILMIFSDGVVEARGIDGELYSINKFENIFRVIAQGEKNLKNIYNNIIDDLKLFRGGTKFDDDVSILLLKRNSEKDLVKKGDVLLDEIKEKENLEKQELKRLEGIRKKDIAKALELSRKERETKRVITILEDLYYSGEILQLKQEAIRFIKEGYIDKKINHYLKKAIDNENKYKIEQKNQKMQNKYNVLLGLFKKGDYDTVIKELEYIILKDGNF